MTTARGSRPPKVAGVEGEAGREATSHVGRGRRGGRAVQPPSWPRVLKRGAIFAPIFLATVMLLGGNKMTFTSAVVQTVLLIGVFIPFSYFMDGSSGASTEAPAPRARRASPR